MLYEQVSRRGIIQAKEEMRTQIHNWSRLWAMQCHHDNNPAFSTKGEGRGGQGEAWLGDGGINLLYLIRLLVMNLHSSEAAVVFS